MKRGQGAHFTPAETAFIVWAFPLYSNTSIAAHLGCTERSVNRAARKAGLDLKNGHMGLPHYVAGVAEEKPPIGVRAGWDLRIRK